MQTVHHQQVVVALDTEDLSAAERLVDTLGARCGTYKVGLQLLTAAGPAAITALVLRGKSVFLDAKLFEIPESVAAAVTAAGKLGVRYISVHATAGLKVLQAAVAAAEPFEMNVLGLTVITSAGDEELAQVGVNSAVREQVLRLAALASSAGCHGVIVSPKDAGLVKSMFSGKLIFTPGITTADGRRSHLRFATATEAVAAGATHVVVGRSVASAVEPCLAFDELLNGGGAAGSGAPAH